ncbi:unnamed protein product [Polarella glacialis]|uniref:Uncharacterized protein n=1 Tax=Polarella glacialis TaxID=89957 RepID=A0A813KD62_POLGL|nr:unnamed protein product [Polarella glacialis]
MCRQYVFAPALVLGVSLTCFDAAIRTVILRSMLPVMFLAQAMTQPSWIHQARSFLNRLFCPSVENNEDDAKVQEMLEQLRISYAKAAIGVFMNVFPPLLVIAACASYVLQRDGSEHESTTHLTMLFIGYAASGLVVMESASSRSCEFGMAFANILIAVGVMVLVPANHWFMASPIRSSARTLIGIGMMNHRQVFLYSIMYVVMYSYGTFASAKQIPGMHAGLGTLTACVLPELASSAFIWATVYLMEAEVKQRLKASLHMTSARGETSAVQGMLSMFCDAQAELNADLRISNPDPKLSRMLRTTASLENVELISFIAEHDQPRFLALVKSSRPVLGQSDGLPLHSTPGLLHAQMRTASGELFSVRFFHVCRLDIHDSPQHSIGICDEGQRTPEEIDENFTQASRASWEHQQLEKKQEQEGEETHSQPRNKGAAFAAPDDHGRNRSASAASSRTSSRTLGSLQRMPVLSRASLFFDPRIAGFPIRETRFVFDPAAGSSVPVLDEWLLPEEQERFRSFLSDFQAAALGENTTVQAAFPMKLKMPGASDVACLLAGSAVVSITAADGVASVMRLDLSIFSGGRFRSRPRKPKSAEQFPARRARSRFGSIGEAAEEGTS